MRMSGKTSKLAMIVLGICMCFSGAFSQDSAKVVLQRVERTMSEQLRIAGHVELTLRHSESNEYKYDAYCNMKGLKVGTVHNLEQLKVALSDMSHYGKRIILRQIGGDKDSLTTSEVYNLVETLEVGDTLKVYNAIDANDYIFRR